MSLTTKKLSKATMNNIQQKPKKHILSFSGGKDSTALLLRMLEAGRKIDDIVYFSMGDWEWPEMIEHIESVKKSIKPLKITTLVGENDKYELIKKRGFPNQFLRWCTTEKQNAIRKYLKKYNDFACIEYIGIAYNERERTAKKYLKKKRVVFPLIDWELTEEDNLEYCYSRGYMYSNLYDELPGKRMSCWCCPMQTIGDIRNLYFNHPDLWDKLRKMQTVSHQAFRMGGWNVFRLEERFWAEKFAARREAWTLKKISRNYCQGLAVFQTNGNL